MLTDKNIQKIIKAQQEAFPAREEIGNWFDKLKQDFQSADAKLLGEIFATRKDLEDFREEMRKSFSDLQTSVNAYAKRADKYFQEMLMLSHKVDRLEKWIHQIAEKIGIKLEH